jgi:Xaa-Pro aminopeptidase
MSAAIIAPLPLAAPDTRAAAREHVLRTYCPGTPEEHILAGQIAENYWRLIAGRRAETALIDDLVANSESPDLALGKALADDPGLMRILRYVTTAERALHISIEHFRRARASRAKSEIDVAKQKTAADRAKAAEAFRSFRESMAESEAEIRRISAAAMAEDGGWPSPPVASGPPLSSVAERPLAARPRGA